MVRLLDADAQERVTSASSLTVGRALRARTAAVPDREVPVFALLRSTMGLPHNNPCWWPEQPGRRRRVVGSVASMRADDHGHVGDHQSASADGGLHAVPTIGGGTSWGHSFALPTVSLLERTLAGLRVWSDASSAEQSRAFERRDIAPATSGAR